MAFLCCAQASETEPLENLSNSDAPATEGIDYQDDFDVESIIREQTENPLPAPPGRRSQGNVGSSNRWRPKMKKASMLSVRGANLSDLAKGGQ